MTRRYSDLQSVAYVTDQWAFVAEIHELSKPLLFTHYCNLRVLTAQVNYDGLITFGRQRNEVGQ